MLAHLSGAFSATGPSASTFASCQEAEYDAGGGADGGVRHAVRDTSLCFYACRGNVISTRVVGRGRVRVMVRSVTRHSVHVLEEGTISLPAESPGVGDGGTAAGSRGSDDRPVEHPECGRGTHSGPAPPAALPWVPWVAALRRAQDHTPDGILAPPPTTGSAHPQHQHISPTEAPASTSTPADALDGAAPSMGVGTFAPRCAADGAIVPMLAEDGEERGPEADTSTATPTSDHEPSWQLPGVFPSAVADGGDELRRILLGHLNTARASNGNSPCSDVATTADQQSPAAGVTAATRPQGTSPHVRPNVHAVCCCFYFGGTSLLVSLVLYCWVQPTKGIHRCTRYGLTPSVPMPPVPTSPSQ